MGKKWSEERKKAKSEEMLEKEWNAEFRKRILEGWRKCEKYKKNEGKHQLEDNEQKKAYQREYHREWYKRNKEKVKRYVTNYYNKIRRQKKNDE